MRPKEEILRSTCTSVLDSLMIVELWNCIHPPATVRIALVVVCPLASLAGLVFSSSFNHSSWLQCYPWLLRTKDFVRRWTCGFHQIFTSSASLKTKMGNWSFLTFSSWSLHWKNQIGKISRVQMNITLQFALYVTTGSSAFFLEVTTHHKGLMRFKK